MSFTEDINITQIVEALKKFNISDRGQSHIPSSDVSPEKSSSSTDHQSLPNGKSPLRSIDPTKITHYQIIQDDTLPNPGLKREYFIIDSEGFVHVFVDATGGGIGVWFSENNPYNVVGKVELVPGPRQAMSILGKVQAATRAVQQASSAGFDKLNVHTDSLFLVRMYINGWISKWKRNRFIKSSGQRVKWKDHILGLDNAVEHMNRVKWSYEKQKRIEASGQPKMSNGMANADKLSRFFPSLSGSKAHTTPQDDIS